MSEKPKKIVIGIPHTGTFHWQTVMALLGLKIPEGYIVSYHLIGSCLVYDAREKIVQYAKEANAEYLLFLDSDMVPPSDMLLKMVTHLKNEDIDAITGMAFKRTAPFQPCFYFELKYDPRKMEPTLSSPVEWPKDGGIMQIQGAGMACFMMKMNVFEKVKAPYFFPLPNLGEDLTFCLKMKAAKLNLYVDLTIDCGHIANMPITSEFFHSCYEERKKSGAQGSMFIEAEQGG